MAQSKSKKHDNYGDVFDKAQSTSVASDKIKLDSPNIFIHAALDPLTNVFYKLFIKDIHNLFEKEAILDDSEKETGQETTVRHHNATTKTLCYYKDHLVLKVEITGLVVLAEQKNLRDIFAVDDGTGVIMCNKWNKKQNEIQSTPNSMHSSLPESLKDKLRFISSVDHSDLISAMIGDVVNVRGRVVLYNGQKEIEIISINKAKNPCAEIDQALSLPELYSKWYDKTVTYPSSFTGNLSSNAEIDCETLFEKAVQRQIQDARQELSTFHFTDTKEWPCVKTAVTSLNTDDFLDDNTIRKILDGLSEKTGLVCRLKDDNYEIIRPNCKLCDHVSRIIRLFCHLEKDAEKGCHTLHIKRQLERYTDYENVQQKVLSNVLEYLEYDSEIISVGTNRYISVL